MAQCNRFACSWQSGACMARIENGNIA